MARGRTEPTSFIAGRPLTLAGVAYAVGATVPNSALRGLRHLSALLSRRVLIPNTPQYPTKRNTAAKRLAKPAPYTLNAKERNGLP